MTAFNPSEFLCLAEELAEDEREAWLRSAISRAYYGVFLVARDAMKVTVRDGRAHRLTRERLMTHGKQLAFRLSLLHGLRKKADYVLDQRVDMKCAADALSIAWDLHRKLLRLKGSARRQRAAPQTCAAARP
ncbi:hypothetical protein FUT87_09835 [Mitsuaria sp. TWR114]|jgi:uncharacterized protein (UPF0332 family)|uniref:hypothetical protein n=1 Tax=unclassified Roseateles TaxID=2626991 RepID=UPI0008E1F50F|nr:MULTISPECIES: hypothetical protein [unclassified Roseateles]MBB3280121.1 uncharacterized protein (UPF0332 family) [Mitsuaria sp. BK037]TXD91650.1 hypothetical protein FUT87_09835 [Mitsuaria sp. TWR114]SFR73570.1 Uncharacterized protein, contains HEPN domain, UPF0332 family [Mitsuaria sp. PDC51]